MCSARNLIPDFTVKDICAHARPNSPFSVDSEGPVPFQSLWQPGCKTSECVALLEGFASGFAQLSAEHPACAGHTRTVALPADDNTT